MKTLYFYLIGKIKGETITWQEAQYEASRVDVEVVICDKIDETLLSINDFYSGIKAEVARGCNAAAVVVHNSCEKLYNANRKFMIGRVGICALRGQFDPHFVFDNVELETV